MISPGHHFYCGPDGRWRCAGPDDRFFTVGGPDAVLEQVQRLLHAGDAGGAEAPSADQPSSVTAALELLARHGVTTAPEVASAAGRAVPTVCVEGENPVAEQVRCLLNGHAMVVGATLDEAAMERADAVVACAGWLPDSRWRALDAICVRHATPWHMAYVEGDTVVVGPMYVPGRTASYADVRGRRLAAAASSSELIGLWEYLESDQPQPPVPWPDAAGAAVVAGFVAADVLAVLYGATCPSEGHQLVVNLHTAQVDRHRVLPLPAFADPGTSSTDVASGVGVG